MSALRPVISRTAGAVTAAVATALLTMAVPAASPAAATATPPSRLRVGTITLRRCAARPVTFCGHLAVPLDYSSAASPRIQLGFRWLPARHRPAGTILAVEGGPGYASTGSEPEYLAMTGPLRATRNLLLVDLRGTGTSTPLNCRGLERAGARQYAGTSTGWWRPAVHS
jgi:hypothetical protein